MAKKIRIAPDGTTTWATLPGNSGDFGVSVETLDDTVFGHAFKSEQPDIISWTVSANAIYKGFGGYQAVIKKTGSAVAFTTEAASQDTGQIYQIDDTAKRIWDVATTFVVFDGGVDQTAEVESIDYLYGKVTFKDTYTVTGAITITGASVPSTQICSMNTFTLSQQAETNDVTDLCIAQSNGGFRQYDVGLRSVSLELSGFYKASNAFLDALKARATVIIELNPDGNSKSLVRGFFKPTAGSQSGNVGATEEESITYMLNVPDNDLLASPLSWDHAADTTLNTAVQTLLSAWHAGNGVEVRYLEDGATGKQGSAIPTDLSLSGGLGALSQFTVNLQGSGGITAV